MCEIQSLNCEIDCGGGGGGGGEEVRVFCGLIDEATAMRFFGGKKEWRLDHRTRRVVSAIR